MTVKPATSPDSLPLWEGYEQHVLRLPRCRACGHHHLPPGPVCPLCFSNDLEWIVASGRGVVSTWVVVQRKYFEDFDPPYPVVQIQLEEGPRLTAGLRPAELERIEIGAAVEVTFETGPNGMTLPVFRLLDDA
jgi:uncharacterized OB-fold protein